MIHSLIGFAMLFALQMLPTIAHAQPAERRGTPEDQRACNLDSRRYCREVLSQGDMAVLACLRQNRSKLTRGCQDVLTRHGQ